MHLGHKRAIRTGTFTTHTHIIIYIISKWQEGSRPKSTSDRRLLLVISLYWRAGNGWCGTVGGSLEGRKEKFYLTTHSTHFIYDYMVYHHSARGTIRCSHICYSFQQQGFFYMHHPTDGGVRCSSVVRAFAHGAMGRRIDPSWGGPIELFLVPASIPRMV